MRTWAGFPALRYKAVMPLYPGSRVGRGFLANQSNYRFRKIPDVNWWPPCTCARLCTPTSAHTHIRTHPCPSEEHLLLMQRTQVQLLVPTWQLNHLWVQFHSYSLFWWSGALHIYGTYQTHRQNKRLKKECRLQAQLFPFVMPCPSQLRSWI